MSKAMNSGTHNTLQKSGNTGTKNAEELNTGTMLQGS